MFIVCNNKFRIRSFIHVGNPIAQWCTISGPQVWREGPLVRFHPRRYLQDSFLPLNDQVYKLADALKVNAFSEWLKPDSAFQITESYDLDDRAGDKLLKNISYNLHKNKKGSYIDKKKGLLPILPRNFADEMVKLHEMGESYNFKVALSSDIWNLTIALFYFGIAECFDHYLFEHTEV